jgi:PadR family transcriptional regulator PadR
MEYEDAKAQLRKGLLEYCVLLVIGNKKVYAADMLDTLKAADLVIVEGTLYPLLTRMKNMGLLDYSWEESTSGPPRKYYSLTAQGKTTRGKFDKTWDDLVSSMALLRN